MNADFLLTNDLARTLYLTCARDLPIIDYHNHLSPADLTGNRKYENIAQLWILSDPYKHRAMRILGIPEERITGAGTDYKKFQAWYGALPRLIGNPLFDWSVMELKMVFDYDLLPFQDVNRVWNDLNERLLGMGAMDILGKFPIEYMAPCAALTEDLSVFDKARGISPSLRGDDLLLPTKVLIQKLETLTGATICTLDDYLSAIEQRLADFRSVGCAFTDHALDNGFLYKKDDGQNRARFQSILKEESLSPTDETQLRSMLLTQLAGLYAGHGLTMQLHIGAQRSTSTRLRTLAGAAGGYAAMGNSADVTSLVTFLDDVEQGTFGLPKTLLFSLNPADNPVLATLSGSYSRDGVEALISQGPAWWWCDHYQGIFAILDHFASHSVLSTFLGMTTDSRSPLSFVRHDYFRRILCEWISRMVSMNRLPDSYELLTDTVTRICYKNAKYVLGGTPYAL